MHKYEIILYWSNEDKAFVAEVPQLTGCAAHGETSWRRWNTSTRLWTCGSIQRRSLTTRFLSPRGSV